MCFDLKNYDSKNEWTEIRGGGELGMGKVRVRRTENTNLVTLEWKNWDWVGVELGSEIGVDKSEFWERGDAGKRGTEWNQGTTNR